MVIWSLPAKKDLEQIFDYIAQDSKYYAKNVANKIIEKTEQLSEFQEMGRVVPEIDDPNIRELIVYSYRLIYEISPERIEILAIIHGRRDFNLAWDERERQ
jgi:addiction module RelE/StbE family toxin